MGISSVGAATVLAAQQAARWSRATRSATIHRALLQNRTGLQNHAHLRIQRFKTTPGYAPVPAIPRPLSVLPNAQCPLPPSSPGHPLFPVPQREADIALGKERLARRLRSLQLEEVVPAAGLATHGWRPGGVG